MITRRTSVDCASSVQALLQPRQTRRASQCKGPALVAQSHSLLPGPSLSATYAAGKRHKL